MGKTSGQRSLCHRRRHRRSPRHGAVCGSKHKLRWSDTPGKCFTHFKLGSACSGKWPAPVDVNSYVGGESISNPDADAEAY